MISFERLFNNGSEHVGWQIIDKYRLHDIIDVCEHYNRPKIVEMENIWDQTDNINEALRDLFIDIEIDLWVD